MKITNEFHRFTLQSFNDTEALRNSLSNTLIFLL